MSSLSGLNTSSLGGSAGTPTLTVGGLVSGMDTDKIITGLLAIDQAKITRISARASQIRTTQAAFQQIEARLLTLQGDVTQLARSVNGVFDGRSATSSDESLVTAAATPSAIPGTYTLRVNSLARAQMTAAQGFDDPGSTITQGTLDLRVGSGAVKTITIDGSNNTLQGLAQAINTAGAGVAATIVNDGSGSQPYRLLLTATGTGSAGAVTMTNHLADSAGNAIKPVFDQSFLGSISLGTGYTGTSVPTVNAGAGAFTGTTNNRYTFTVVTGGTVGTDNNLQVAYADASGQHTGTLTINAADVDQELAVAEGVRVKFAAGTLVAGQTFSVKGYVPTVQDAADASVTLGSGAGALTLTSSTNTLDGLLPGVTLNLKGSDPGQTVSVQVASDVQAAHQAVKDFVTAYNDLMSKVDELTAYDSQSGQGGPLLGNRSATQIQDSIRAAVSDVVAGLGPQANRLSILGISTDDNGRLVLNDATLTDVLAGNKPGVTLADVRRIFALSAASTNPGFQFITGSTKTKASATPYTVQITQAAEQARVTAASVLAASTTIDATNNTFALTVDGTSVSVTLASGNYTAEALSQAVQGAINDSPNLAGRRVTVGLDAGRLSITSASYGSTSQIAIGAGSANAALGLSGTESSQGKDVAGSFLVGGMTETARGIGQLLIGDAGNANTADAQLRITLTAAQVGAGTSADLTITRGIASKVDLALNSLLDPVSGRMKSIDDDFKTQLDDLDAQTQRQNDYIATRRQNLLQQFAAMETTLAKLQAAGSFLNAQTNASLSSKK